MYGGDEFLRISRFDNGFSVEIKDPGIVKYNKANDGKEYEKRKPYKDPWRNFIFPTAKKAIAFLEKNLDKAVTAAKTEDTNEFETAFDLAVVDDDEKAAKPALRVVK